MPPVFASRNIRLDDGTRTKPDVPPFEEYLLPQMYARLLTALYPTDRQRIRIIDLGCLDGAYSIEFARLGFDVMAIECRDANIECCRYVQANCKAEKLQFIQDDALNLPNYGTFDVVFCSGLLYHLENPRAYLTTLAKATKNVLILNTHYSYTDRVSKHPVSEITTHEGLPGRWYKEFEPNTDTATRDRAHLSSWKNDRSFWILKSALQTELNQLGLWVFEHNDGREDAENRTAFICFKW